MNNNQQKKTAQGFVDHSSVVNLAGKPLKLIKAYQPYQIQSTNPNPGCFVETAKNTINDGWDDKKQPPIDFRTIIKYQGFLFLAWDERGSKMDRVQGSFDVEISTPLQ